MVSGILIHIIRAPKSVFSVLSEIAYYLKTKRAFKKADSENQKYETLPIFFQRRESTFDRHYVYQAYWAASIIKANLNNIEYHTDISSNISYVVQLAAFVPVHFIEYNPPILELKGDIAMKFKDGDKKCVGLAEAYEQLCKGEKCNFFDEEIIFLTKTNYLPKNYVS